MLQIKDLEYIIGDRVLFKELNWIVNPGRRIALIGKNGAGKTTLLRIIHGELEAHGGEMQAPKGYRIGYLPQEEAAIASGTILDSALTGMTDIKKLERQIAAVHRELGENKTNQAALLERLGILEDQFDHAGGYTIEAQAKSVLSGLGFRQGDFVRPMTEFSGGWRMRVYLARLLIQQPDLLLLDEPTNHLDLPSLEWLENFLRTFPGSIVLVSHDRFFIDRLAQEICELDHGRLTFYAGNYHFYENEKVSQLELLMKRWEEQKAERERIQRFIDRFRYKNTKAKQVQSRIKQLEKMETIEIPPASKEINFRIQVETSSYKDVLTVSDMSFRYEEPWVLQDLNLNMYRGDRIALVGVNGAGKTTFTRLIMQELSPQRGQISLGERVVPGYYAQHQVDALNLEATVMDEVSITAAEKYRTRLRDILGLFHLSGDDVEKRIGVLSGGEKARVSLAKILLSPVNFLIMDEPTNHLDVGAREALETALAEYDGTLLLISHDRYFLDKLVHRVIEINNGRLKHYEGNYLDYLDRRQQEITDAAPARSLEEEADERDGGPGRKSREQKRQEAEARQAISKQRKHIQKEIEALEATISDMESRKVELDALMADPDTYQNGRRAADLQKEYKELNLRLNEMMVQWEGKNTAIEALLAQLG